MKLSHGGLWQSFRGPLLLGHLYRADSPLRNYVHDSGLAVGNITRVWVGPCRERGLCIVKLEFVKQETHPMEQVTWAEEPQQIPAPDKTKLRRLLLSLLSWETKPLDVPPPLPNVR